MSKHVMILGCGRSGTSIFGELFEHLPVYQYYSEPSFKAYIHLDFSSPTAVKVPTESAGYPPTEGLSIPLGRVRQQFGNDLQLYWQVRHPLDTICSLKVGISRNWGHHPRPPDWQQWLDNPLLEQCAYHWAYLNTVGFRQVESLCNITRFEELIRNPRAFAEGICQDLGIDSRDRHQAIDKWAARVQDRNNSQFVEALTSRPYSTQDHQVKVGRWRENMTLEEVRQVIPIIKDAAHHLGYQLPNPDEENG